MANSGIFSKGKNVLVRYMFYFIRFLHCNFENNTPFFPSFTDGGSRLRKTKQFAHLPIYIWSVAELGL